MGMFDTIIYKDTVCAECGAIVDNYQSKDGDCELQKLTPVQLLSQSGKDAVYFYGYCNNDDWNDPSKPHHKHTYRVGVHLVKEEK